jgi:hypothetical protein
VQRPKLGPWLGIVDQILEDDKLQPKQRHTAKRIWDRLKAEHGFQGGYIVMKDYVREARLQHKEVFVPLVHPPGEAQVDFGEALVVIGGDRTEGSGLRVFHRSATDHPVRQHQNCGEGDPSTKVGLNSGAPVLGSAARRPEQTVLRRWIRPRNPRFSTPASGNSFWIRTNGSDLRSHNEELLVCFEFWSVQRQSPFEGVLPAEVILNCNAMVLVGSAGSGVGRQSSRFS